MAQVQRSYDHRLRDLVRDTGDVKIATRLGVPGSTAAGWLRRKDGKVVTGESVPDDLERQRAIAKLKRFEANRSLACARCSTSTEATAAA